MTLERTLAKDIVSLAPTDTVTLHWQVQGATYWATKSVPLSELQTICREWLEDNAEVELPHSNC